MKLIRQVRLRLTEGNSDKVYEVDLCEVGTDQYVVNFRYGRYGKSLREGSKTDSPVDLATAETLFSSVVVSKVNKGYQEVSSTGPEAPPAFVPVPAAETEQEPASDGQSQSRGERIRYLLNALDKAAASKRTVNQADRLIWRLGELRVVEAAQPLTQLIGSSAARRDYCIAWSLSRIANPAFTLAMSANIDSEARSSESDAALAGLKSLHQSPNIAVRRITSIGLARSGDEQVAATAKAALPEALLHLLQTPPTEVAVNRVADAALNKNQPASANSWLFDLYVLAQQDQVAHEWVCALSGVLPLKAGTFIRIRHWFKAVECLDDARLFGVLVRRFELERQQFWMPDWDGAYTQAGTDWVKAKPEIRKPNSRLAYSQKTREYLRRRSWRHTHKLAAEKGAVNKAESHDYVQLAAGVLLALQDADGGAERRQRHTGWVQENGRWMQKDMGESVYPPFSRYRAFNEILHKNSSSLRPTSTGRAWMQVANTNSAATNDQRQEALPQYWDRHPQLLLQLLRECQVQAVAEFSAKALSANTAFGDEIESAVLLELLARPYNACQQFALTLAQRRWQPNNPDTELLLGLLRAPLLTARQQACQWLDADRSNFLDAYPIIATAVTSAYQDTRQWGDAWLQRNSYYGDGGRQLLAHIIAELLGLDGDAMHEPRVIAVGETLLARLSSIVKDMSLEVLRDLLAHPLTANQALAGRLLAANNTPAERLPPELLEQLINSDAPAVRAAGVALFGQLPDSTLRTQLDLLLAFVVAKDPETRAAAKPVLARLAERDSRLAADCLQRLLPYFFQSEKVEGLHADLLSLAKNELRRGLDQIDIDTTWRLVNARSKAAQKLGGELLLNGVSHRDVSVRQLAGFASSAELRVREWAWQGYNADPSRMRANADDALRLLDSRWPDSRNFGFEWFGKEFRETTWTPDLLVAVCDSPKEDVQQFGRQLLTRFFQEQDGPEYLLRLSQHPSQAVQLFASNFLQVHAGGQPERILALQPYFLTVLGQVNRGRVAKSRVLKFFEEQAVLDERVAAMVNDILSRQSVTVAIGDKAACMELLAELGQRFPALASPLQRQPMEQRPARSALAGGMA